MHRAPKASFLTFTSILALLLSGAEASAARASFAAVEKEFDSRVHPLLERYCYDCHSTEKQKGDLDLQRFRTLSEVRKDPRVWEQALEQLSHGEMPPAKSPQPSEAERQRMRRWIRDYLHQESLAQAGDPGRVLMRRLSNAEYDATVRDLTGVDLKPSREFPVDGAAGEGFVNTGEALVMSPALVDKYLDAGKTIAGHAVLLPDGFRFSASSRRGDWVAGLLAEIKAFYARYTDNQGGTRINLQGIQFDTNTGGRLPIERYLAALIEERDQLRQSKSDRFEAVAIRRGLHAKYLRGLWNLLEGREPLFLIDGLRARWKSARPGLEKEWVEEITRWQGALTKFQTVGHMRPWMVPVDPIAEKQEIRHVIPVPEREATANVVLGVNDAGDGATEDVVVWENPRLALAGGAQVPLRDLRVFTERMLARRERVFASAARSLAAATEFLDAPDRADRQALAAKHQLDPADLQAWFDGLGLGSPGSHKLELMTGRIEKSANYDFVKGWGSGNTPNLVANASTQHVRIPGNVPGRGVAMHPAPKHAVAAGWRSPLRGLVRVQGKLTHAHPECGNGVTWSLELRRGGMRQRLASGIAQGNRAGTLGPIEDVSVQEGDLLSVVVGPRDGNHSCDLTGVEFSLREKEGARREWDLAKDIADDVLAGNPHADRWGHAAVWHFYMEPIAESGAVPSVIPPGSILSRWSTERSPSQRASLARDFENLLRTGPPSGTNNPDRTLFLQLASATGPLLFPQVAACLKSDEKQPTEGNSDWALPPDIFGHHPNHGALAAADLCVRAPAWLEMKLPGSLFAGCEFLTTAKLHESAGGAGSVQVSVSSSKPGAASGLSPAPFVATGAGRGAWGSDAGGVSHTAPVLAKPGSTAWNSAKKGFETFRTWFPAALGYTKIVPVDEVITLTVFHREDEPLLRLMLNEEEKAQLDKLWAELRFVGQDALTIVDAYAQLMEDATQDSNPKLFEHLREPITSRAAAFRSEMEAAEPRHLDHLIRFAHKAWRRPTTSAEESELRRLYGSLRAEKLGHEEAFRLTLARVLVAPSFLYRVEQPQPGAEPRPVSSWEMANRLSYFLWSSLPDEALFQSARQNRLLREEDLVVHGRRMLQDPKVRALAVEFACQWLHLRDFDTHDEKSERHFPAFASLRGAMYEEAIRFFVDLFQRDGSVLEILNADHVWVNAELARHYGIPGVEGAEWKRVERAGHYGRGGVLGMAAVLSKQAGASRTSPILRGNWLVETLLGEKLPKPPPNVPPLPQTEAETGELTVRDITEKHSKVPECAVCHVRIDPFGYALERYDAIGTRRDRDAAGRPIDVKVELPLTGKPVVEDMAGLRRYLAEERGDEIVRVFCRKLLGYSLGRALKLSDKPLVERMMTELKRKQYRVSAAMETILKSRQFRYQRGLEATVEEKL